MYICTASSCSFLSLICKCFVLLWLDCTLPLYVFLNMLSSFLLHSSFFLCTIIFFFMVFFALIPFSWHDCYVYMLRFFLSILSLLCNFFFVLLWLDYTLFQNWASTVRFFEHALFFFLCTAILFFMAFLALFFCRPSFLTWLFCNLE